MKELDLQEMENIQATGLGRDCMIAGFITFTSVLGGSWLGAVASVGYAAGIGCFDQKLIEMRKNKYLISIILFSLLGITLVCIFSFSSLNKAPYALYICVTVGFLLQIILKKIYKKHKHNNK